MNAPSKPLPPPTLRPSRGAAGYQEKVRAYIAERRSFLASSAIRKALAIVVAAAFLIIAGDVFLGLRDWTRWVALAGLLGTGVVLLSKWWWRPAGALGDAEAVRELERGFPDLGQRLRTTREIEAAPASNAAERALASALMAETAHRMKAIDPGKLIPWRQLRAPMAAALLAVAAFAVALAAWPEFRTGAQRLIAPSAGFSFTKIAIAEAPTRFTDRESPRIVARLSGRRAGEATLHTREEGGDWMATKMARVDASGAFDAVLTGRAKSFEFYITAGDGRSELRRMRCYIAPKIEKAFAALELPEYTGLGEKRSEGGDVRAVEGSRARVTFQLNHPLTTVAARTADGRDLPITSSGTELVLEQKLARGEVIYQLTGRDADGTDLAPVSYKLVGLEDKIPEVKLVEPAKDLEATSVWEVLARLEAKDDFGVAEVGIILVVGNDMKLLAQRQITERDVRTAGEMGSALLEEFPLTINDNLKLYAYARDHKPRDGARSVSNLRAIDIRQFKTRWRFLTGGEAPMSGSQLQELMNLVKEQRRVVSDTFVLKENGAPSDGDLGKVCDGIREREEKLAERALALKAEVEVAGTMARDDLALLDTAAQQMGEAAKHLEGRLSRPAYRQADRALSSLLELRKLIMKILSQNKAACPACEEEQKPAKSMTDLAREAERLAGEERAVREAVAGELPPERELEVTRQKQAVAVTDAGELFAALVTSPEATELALQRMEEAEKEMQTAEEKLRNAVPKEASPGLQSAEEKLLALAEQLRALDEKNLIDTLGKLAEQSAKAKEKMEQEKKEREEAAKKQEGAKGDAKGAESGGAKKGEQKPGEADGKNDGSSGSGEKPGEGKEQQGEGKEQPGKAGGDQPGKSEGQGKAELAAIEKQTAALDDILKSLAQRKGAGPGGERLSELREEAKTGALNPDVRDLRKENQNAKGAERAGDLAGRFGKLAEGLSREQRRMQQSRVENLAKALARTRELQKRSAEAAEEKAGREGGEKPGTEGGKGDAKSEKPFTAGGGGGAQPQSRAGGAGGYDPNAIYLKDLAQLQDEILGGFIPHLADDLKQGGFDEARLKAVEERLAKIVDELLRPNATDRRAERIPDEYHRMVEEYFRALSEDFAGEEWTPEEK